ncbi:GNAT family N-acetyltransferase [uncultured Croceitalea sp.]|uniref:GNAT family N-acetyltransferase n=1 Tax=uncultured Croceitalea sp. TaxID=1798908 RepID=UPI0033062F2F
MWPNKPIAYVKLPNDDQGQHFGLFSQDKLIAVISLFIDGNDAQFRKFATLRQEQGKGHGTVLLQFILKTTIELSLESLWCNARADKTYFYEKFGMQKTDKQFLKGGIHYVIMEKQLKVEI